MPETLYLIDAYAQIFRAYYAIRGGMRSSITSEPTQAVFGFTGMLFKLMSQFKPHYVVVAIDSAGPTFRDEIYTGYQLLRQGYLEPEIAVDGTLGPDEVVSPDLAPRLGAQYTEYKGTRDATPDDLISQIPRVFEVVEAFGLPVIGELGIEADDVIATITERILSNPAYDHVHIRIVSKDKDLEQLICDRVSLFDIHTDALIDAKALLEKKGILPHQVIDVLALMGDTVDNVPGIEGIGLKTAVQLLQQFGTIDGIYQNIDSIKGKRQENLIRGRHIMPISRAMVTLKRDAEFPFTLDSARVGAFNSGLIVPIFEQLGFHRFLEDAKKLEIRDSVTQEAAVNAIVRGAVAAEAQPVGAVDGVPYETAANGQYEAVVTAAQLEKLARTLREYPIIALDTETTGIDRDSVIVGLSFSWKEGCGVYVPILSPQPASHLDSKTVLDALRAILEDPTVEKCGHNLKFDAAVLRRHGVHLRGVVFDSMLASIMIDPARPAHKLDSLALSELYYQMIPITDLIGMGDGQITMDRVPLDIIAPYAAEDTDIALRMYHKMLPEIEKLDLNGLMRDIEAPLTVVLAEMEQNGILCDTSELDQQGELLKARVLLLRKEIFELAGTEFHLDSTQQLADVLFDKLGFTSGKKTKTGRSTDISVLEKLAAQEDRNKPVTAVPRLIMEYRQLTKLISTYLGNLQASVDKKDGRIHTSFHQLVTATGRLASHNPNLQNIPVRSDAGKQIRKAFHSPDEHVLICADYSQAELRVLAHLSEDAGLIDAFESDQDIHASVASQVFGVDIEAVTREQRARAKTINFGIIYGITPFGLSRRIEGLDVGAASALIEAYKVRFPGIQTFLMQCIDEALNTGKVRTVSGRMRAIPEIHSMNRMQRSLGERLAINTAVQGSAADLIKAAMVNLSRRIDTDALPMRLLLQIHDELVIEAPAVEAQRCAAIVCEVMEGAMQLRVPLKADAGIGKDWLAAK